MQQKVRAWCSIRRSSALVHPVYGPQWPEGLGGSKRSHAGRDVTFAGSLRLGVKASRYTQATIYAQNVMSRRFTQNFLDDGEESGEFPGGYAWRARVQEIHPDEDHSRLQPNRQNPTDLFHLKEIEVRVTWSEGNGEQNLVLRSLRTLTEQPIQ